MRYIKGQSLAEFLVALVVLVPLLLMVPLLGKYIDMNQATLQASRYVAQTIAQTIGDRPRIVLATQTTLRKTS